MNKVEIKGHYPRLSSELHTSTVAHSQTCTHMHSSHHTPQRLDEDQRACVHTPKGETRIRAACTCCRFPEDPKGIVGKTKRAFCAVSRSYALVKTENTLGECNCCLERSRNLTGSAISWANSATPTVYAMSPVWGSIFFHL